jgi:hypothetical protein
MSSEDTERPGGSGEEDLGPDEVDVRDALRRVMREPAGRKPAAQLLSGVHRKIREQSEGRYFADGWSTHSSPRATFLVTSLLMLLVVLLAWLLLAPYGIEIVW